MNEDLEYLLTFFAIAYACLAFVKFMLCAPHIPRAIGVLSRLAGAERGHTLYRYVFLVPLLLMGVSVLGWVVALYREGFGFFAMYKNYNVISDCVRAYRLAHADDIEE